MSRGASLTDTTQNISVLPSSAVSLARDAEKDTMHAHALLTAVTAALAIPAAAAGISKRAAQTATAAYSAPSKHYDARDAAASLHRRADSAAPATICSELNPFAGESAAITPVCCARLVEPDASDAGAALSALGFGVQGALAQIASWALAPGAEAMADGALVGLTCSELGSAPGAVDDWCVSDHYH